MPASAHVLRRGEQQAAEVVGAAQDGLPAHGDRLFVLRQASRLVVQHVGGQRACRRAGCGPWRGARSYRAQRGDHRSKLALTGVGLRKPAMDDGGLGQWCSAGRRRMAARGGAACRS